MSMIYGKRFGGARDTYHLIDKGSSVAICGRIVDASLSFIPTGARVCGHCLIALRGRTVES